MKLIIYLMQIAICLFLSTSVIAKTLLVDVELYWKPTTEIVDLKKNISFTEVKGNKIKINLLKDSRKVNPMKRIGENAEEKTVLPVETKMNIAEFVTEGLTKAMVGFGLEASTTEKADYVLDGEVVEFFTTETNTYGTITNLNLVLKRSGKVVWKGTATGKNSRFGRSYKLDNYMESLSDSLIDLTYNLLDSSDFKKAFQTKMGKN
jgi:hypothetical protein